jgi:hypothetical protein
MGISERLQNSVDILARKLGYPPIVVPRSNISNWNEPVTDGAKKEFEENNLLEVLIYKYVKNNWENNS